MDIQAKKRAIKYLLQTYSTVLPEVLYRMTLSLLVNPRGTQTFLNRVLDGRDFREEDKILKSVDIKSILPKDSPKEISLKIYQNFQKGITHEIKELTILALLVSAIQPQNIFEFGTHVGRTTRLFSMLTSDETRIFTIDLPQEQTDHSIGSAYKGTPESTKINQLYSDTMDFDYTEYYNSCEFVWVDACHQYEHVLADTKEALKICKVGGYVAWHDYRHSAWWSGVTRAIREVNAQYGDIQHIRGSTIAVMKLKKSIT